MPFSKHLASRVPRWAVRVSHGEALASFYPLALFDLMGWVLGTILLLVLIYAPIVPAARAPILGMLYFVLVLTISATLVVRQRRRSKRQRAVLQTFD